MIPSLLPVLLEATLRALVAALSVWTGLRLLRVKNLLAQKAAWGLLLIAALAMPLLMRSQWLPAWASVKLPTASWTRIMDAKPPAAPAPAVSTSQMSGPEMMQQPVPEPEERFPAPVIPAAGFQAPPSSEVETVPARAPAAAQSASKPAATGGSRRWLAMGWILYLGVCATLLSRLLWGLGSSLWLWIGAKPVEALEHVDLPGSVCVCWSSRIASPVNIGSGILLPADYVEWDEEKLRVVLAHEHSHIRQRDFYLQFLAGLYTALTWFSPLGWWLKHKLSELGEAISDRAGLNAATSPSAYAGLLLEFAALPRPTLTGVAMAHSNNLSHRIERLLNDSSFRLGFAGGRRALLTLLVPAVLIVATAMVRVQAAVTPQQMDSSQSALTGQSNPQPAHVSDSGSGQAPQAAEPQPEPALAPPMPPSAAPSPGPASEPQSPPPAPPAPAGAPQESMPEIPPMPVLPVIPPIPPINVDVHIPPIPEIAGLYANAYGGHKSCWGDGDAYAIVGDPGSQTRFCGNWGPDGAAEVDKARSKAHGHFLLFRHEGKSYIVDDPEIVSQIEAMDKSREALSAQMRALGEQMRDAGRQAREAARKARETAANIPTPDLSKEIAALDASVASLKDKQGGTISREQLQELQREISAMQRHVMEAEVRVNMDLSINGEMAKFGQEQGKFGEEMGKLGVEMGRMAQENHEKVRSIIDESLKNGKARPVD